MWFAMLYIAALARLGFDPEAIEFSSYIAVAIVAASVQVIAGVAFGL